MIDERLKETMIGFEAASDEAYGTVVTEALSPEELEAEAADGHTPLTKACDLNDLGAVEYLWRCGARLNFETTRGRTPLAEAAKAGHLETCRFLVDRGATIRYVTKQRKTAVQWASFFGHAAVQRQLRRDDEV